MNAESLGDRDAAQPSHGDGDSEREIDALLPSEQGAEALAILVGDLPARLPYPGNPLDFQEFAGDFREAKFEGDVGA